MIDNPRVEVINRTNPAHRIQFPTLENAERWLTNLPPAQWCIAPLKDEHRHDCEATSPARYM